MFRLTLLLLIAAVPLTAQTPHTPVERPVAGAFAADQVARGETVFRSFCASCHEPTFHTGEQFKVSWYGRTLFDYFKTVKTTMPEDNPGGLADDDYVRVIAYIMTLNGYAPGADSLKADSLELKRTRISEPPRSP